MLNRILLRAFKPNGMFVNGDFNQSRLKVSFLLRIVVKKAIYFIEIPFAGRIEFFNYVVDKEARLVVNNIRISAPLRTDLLSSFPEPDRVRPCVDRLDPPLQISQ